MSSSSNNIPYLNRNTARSNLSDSLDTLIADSLRSIGPSMLVRVEAVHGGGVALTGKVDVRLLIDQQDGLGRPHPRGIVYDVPYLRIQGGNSALIVDPKPGDIGFIVVSGRDHSHVVVNRAPAPPASSRLFAVQDCVYVGGFLNDGPNQYVHFTDTGIRIITPGKVEVQAGGDATIQTQGSASITAQGNASLTALGTVSVTAGGPVSVQASAMTVGCNLSVLGDIHATGDVVAGKISLTNHVHPGVKAGTDKTEAPQ
ncbi:phage baseplate protein [Saccharibacter sp. 17.LH.SD]|uniref:phage baseplate protein n=1 Tax=Saccharibacter sp. 17.LH.SD TaxID=2689393 RepID=UPI001368F0E5|nr:phage baseplate protein [Saccharibacter sp. 17.LH.SD]MXV44388.1 phage baseplate protein [Saccharibacter sp. 17.LH.SD]